MMRHFMRSVVLSLAIVAVGWSMVRLSASTGFPAGRYGQLAFEQLDSGAWFWMIAAIVAVVSFTLLSLLRYERQLIPPRLRLTLLSLRLLQVLVLFLTLLQPVWSWSPSAGLSKRVVVMLDVSASMETVDANASREEKILWARAIGLLPEIGTDPGIDRWIADWVANVSPETRDSIPQDDPRGRLLDQLLTELQQSSRFDLARAALTGTRHAPLDELHRTGILQVTALAGETLPWSLEQFGDPAEIPALTIELHRTDFSRILEAVQAESEASPLSAVVLVSDGRATDVTDMGTLPERLQSLGVPVHTVLVGSDQRSADIAIVAVDSPQAVFPEDHPLIKVLLRTDGLEHEPVTVSLDFLDEPGRQPARQTVHPNGPLQEVVFSVEPLRVGQQRLRVRVDPLPRETRNDNNTWGFSLQIVDARPRVLLLDGDGRWEFRYLDETLTRDERLDLDHVLFDQPYLGLLSRPEFPARLEDLELAAPPATPFSGYDVVICGDVSPEQLPLPVWEQLERFVREEGGTLILTAGRKFFPAAFRGTLVERLLPVEQIRPVVLPEHQQVGPPSTRGFKLNITPEGQRLPMFQLTDPSQVLQRQWSELPGHDWGLTGTARGGATVWASLLPDEEQSGLDWDRQQALMVQQPLGMGQVVWIGIDSTWRWRYLVGEQYHHRFWGQLVRWAATGRASARNDQVQLTLKTASIETGEAAFVQARWQNSPSAQGSQFRPAAVFERQQPGEPFSLRVPFSSLPGQSDAWEAVTTELPAGEYRVRLDVEQTPGTTPPPELLLTVREPQVPEQRDLTADPALLRRIAAETGGEFLQLSDVGRLQEILDNRTLSEPRRQVIPLWSHWGTLVLFCCLALTEWLLRKRAGLP